MSPGREVRIGDAEREAAASALGEHFASGRLTHEEYDERSARVWSAKTNSDLWPLFADLPSPHVKRRGLSPAVAVPADARSRRSGGLRVFPLLVVLAVLVVALHWPPWPLLLLGWLWVIGFFRGGLCWGRWSRPDRAGPRRLAG